MFFPQTAAPLTAVDIDSYSADPLYHFANGTPIIAASSLSLPDLSTPYTAAVATPQDQATELSYEIAAQETVVEYLTNPLIGASTDWVISMPTRRYHLAVDYSGPRIVSNRGTYGNPGAAYFTGLLTDESLVAGQSCYKAFLSTFIEVDDREGIMAPTIAPDLRLVSFCGMVSVLSMRGAASPPSATLRAATTRTNLADNFRPDGSVKFTWWTFEQGKGLPVVARQFARAVNDAASPGVSGTYGATTAGRTSIRGALPQ